MDYGPLFTAAAAAFTGIVGSFFTWLATRPKNQADAHATEATAQLTGISGFQILVQELQKERVELAKVIEKQAGQIERQTTEIERLRAEVAGLRGDVEDILARWRRGEDAPPHPAKGNRA